VIIGPVEGRHANARMRLRTRTERLLRLIEGDAPGIILANELALVRDAFMLTLNTQSDAMHAGVLWHDVDTLRRAWGWCISEGCDRKIDPADACWCAECSRQAAKDADSLDGPLDGPTGEA